MKKYEIFGIGNALVDIECRIDLKELESFELRKGFMTLVSAPKQGELLSSNHLKSKDIKQSCGGQLRHSRNGVCLEANFFASGSRRFIRNLFCEELRLAEIDMNKLKVDRKEILVLV